MPTRHEVNHEVEVIKVVKGIQKSKAAEEVEEKTKIPKLVN